MVFRAREEVCIMDIAKKIRVACADRGISVAELARRLGTSPQNMSGRLKVGKFSGEELEKIAEALGGAVELSFTFSDGTKV